MKRIFRTVSTKVSIAAGSALAFVGAVIVVTIWAVSGPFFGFSDTWQLVINTGTTIVTFLMVFLIQNTQSRDTKAMQLKLDELIRSATKARDSFVDLEKLTDEELTELDKEFQDLREKQPASPAIKKLHTSLQAEHAKRKILRMPTAKLNELFHKNK